MSITSEIERIKTNIANIYAEAENKGATITGERNSDNLASVVTTIPSGIDTSVYINPDIRTIAGSTGTTSYPGFFRVVKKIDSNYIGKGPFETLTSGFAGAINLEEVDFTGIDISGAINMTTTFYRCPKLKKINLSNKTLRMSSIQSICYEDSELTEINLTNTTIAALSSVSTAFYKCSKLEALQELDGSKFTSIGSVLTNCSSLETFGGFKDLGKAYTQTTANYSPYGLDLSTCTSLTHDSLMNAINKLYDLNLAYNVANGGTLYTQKLVLGSTNLAKLTADEIAIATNKGWTVS